MLDSFVGTILPFVAVLVTIIFVHEYGHYIVARWCGVHAQVFSIGLGKEIVSRHDKRGTKWRIAILPIGGYVKFLGDTNAASMPVDDENTEPGLTKFEQDHSFPTAALWKRAAIVAAGPIFNFVLSILIFAALSITYGLVTNNPVAGNINSSTSNFIRGDVIKEVNGRSVDTLSQAVETVILEEVNPARITVERNNREVSFEQVFELPMATVNFVQTDSPADIADLQVEDTILEINGTPVKNFRDVQSTVANWQEGSKPLRFVIARNNSNLNVDITPKLQERMNPQTQQPEMLPTIGISSGGATPEDVFGFEASREKFSPLDALWFGTQRTYDIISVSLSYMADMITGKQSTDQLGGPIGIARISGDAAQSGAENFLAFIALISTSIGLLNLFPIPILDGGHLVFYAIEAVRGKPASQRLMEISTSIGVTMLLGIMIFATWNDIMRL